MDERTAELVRQAKTNRRDLDLARKALRALERSGVTPPRWLSQRVNPMAGVQKARDIKSQLKPNDTAACVSYRDIVSRFYTNPWPSVLEFRGMAHGPWDLDDFYGPVNYIYNRLESAPLAATSDNVLSREDSLLRDALEHEEDCDLCDMPGYDEHGRQIDSWLNELDAEVDGPPQTESKLTAPQKRLI